MFVVKGKEYFRGDGGSFFSYQDADTQEQALRSFLNDIWWYFEDVDVEVDEIVKEFMEKGRVQDKWAGDRIFSILVVDKTDAVDERCPLCGGRGKVVEYFPF